MNPPAMLVIPGRPLSQAEQEQVASVLYALSTGYTQTGGNILPYGVMVYQLTEGRWVKLES